MSRNATRKIVLLSLAAVLLCVYIFQLYAGNKSKTQTLTIKDEITSLVIYAGSSQDNALIVNRDQDNYTVSTSQGTEQYAANNTTASSLFDSISEMHILGNAAKLSSSNEERFGLDANSSITVQVKNGDKTIRTVHIGKNSSTGSQSYVTIDESNQILICSKSMHSLYSATVDDLRSKEVYSVPSETITQINVNSGESNFSLAKSTVPASTVEDDGDGQELSIPESYWSISNAGEESASIALDQDIVKEWVSYISSLNASSWVDEKSFDKMLTQSGNITFISNGTSYNVQFFEIEGDENLMLCSTNVSPYRFYVSKYVYPKFARSLSELNSGGEND